MDEIPNFASPEEASEAAYKLLESIPLLHALEMWLHMREKFRDKPTSLIFARGYFIRTRNLVSILKSPAEWFTKA